MAPRISWNSARGTATSAIWKITDWPCLTIRAQILTCRLRSVVSNHCFTSSGSATVRRKLARSYASACSCSRTALAAKRWQDSRVQVTAFLPSLTCYSAVPR